MLKNSGLGDGSFLAENQTSKIILDYNSNYAIDTLIRKNDYKVLPISNMHMQ